MSLVDAYPMVQVGSMPNPRTVYDDLMGLLIRLAEHGLVHGDFNEFNLMIDDDEKITMIDFPQMVSTSHPNGRFYFERDVRCVQKYFAKHYGMVFDGIPILETDIDRKIDLDLEVRASGFVKDALGENADKIFDEVGDELLQAAQGEDEGEQEDDSEDTDSADEQVDGEQQPDQVECAPESGDEEEKHISGDSESSDEEVLPNQNRKVRFAETFAQREELKNIEDDEANPDRPEKVVVQQQQPKEGELPSKPKKMRVNQEYVKDKV